MNKSNIALFWYKTLEYPVRQWKKGKMSTDQYNKIMGKAYESLKRLELSDEKAKEILAEIEESVA